MSWVAVKTLVADRGKLLTALVGVIFAVVLVNVQGGLFLGLIYKASLLVEHGQADVWVGHKLMHNVDLPSDIPQRWINRVKTVPGVKRAAPYLIGVTEVILPSGKYENVCIVGVDRATLIGAPWNMVQGTPDAILEPDGVVFDESESQKLENPQIGDCLELGGRRARIVGVTRWITGFLVMPYIFCTHEQAAVYLNKQPDVTSYFLVQLEPGADVNQVCDAIRSRVPELEVYPRDVYSQISIDHWMTRTGLGISFGAATLLGLLVGMVMVGQTLYAMVLDRLGEFGTLKAIGATEPQVYSILLVHGVLMALVGSIIGLTLTAAIQGCYSTPRAPIVIPWWVALGSCALVTIICLVSSWLPYHRIRAIDPMMVLQS